MLNRTAHIVGRGIIGLSLAYELGKRGWRVFVVGPQDRPGSATRAAVGASSMKGQTNANKPLFAVKMYGHEGLCRWIEEVQAAAGVPVRHAFSGLFEAFSSSTEFAWIRERVFHKQFTGCLNVELLDRGQLIAKGLPADLLRPEWAGAFRYPGDGWVHPGDLLKALEAAHLELGGAFIESPVTKIFAGPGGELAVETSEGTVMAETLVLAAGIFSNEILASSGISGLEQQGVPGETLIGPEEGKEVALRAGKLNYVRAGGEFRCGSTPFDGISGDLQSVSNATFGNRKSFVQRKGTRGRFRDRLPVIGKIPVPGATQGLWVSLGYYKNGIQLSHLFAQKLTAMIEGSPLSEDVRPFLPSRFPAFAVSSSAFLPSRR